MAGEAAASGLRFFLDRGLGSRLVPEALRAAGWVLETMDERYGKSDSQRIPDTRWIQEATQNGDLILCKDLQIAHNPLEAQVVYMSSARVFALANAQVTGKQIAEWYLAKEAGIVQMASRAEGPYVVAVHIAKALRRVSLVYPPK